MRALLLAVWLCFSSVVFAISSEEKLTQLLAENRWEAVINESHDWLKTDSGALVPKLRGAEALTHLGLYHSANFYLRKIAAADWRRPGQKKFVPDFYRVYASLVQHVPWEELVEIPADLKVPKPTDNDARFALGYDAYSRKANVEALGLLSKIPSTDLRGEQAALICGAIAIREKQYPKAVAFFNQVSGPDGMKAKGRALYAMKDYAGALEALQTAAQSDKSPELKREIAWTLVGLKKMADALKVLVSNDSGEDAATDLMRGELALRLSKREIARTSALRAEKNLSEDLERSAPASIDTPSLAALRKEIAFVSDHSSAPAFGFLGEQLLNVQGRMGDRARGENRAAAAKFRSEAERLWIQSRILLSRTILPEEKTSEDYPSAVQEALRLVEDASEKTKGGSPDLEMAKAQLLWKASSLQKEASPQLVEKALHTADRVYRAFPNYRGRAHAIFFLANAHLNAGRLDDAYGFLNEFIRMAPKDRRISDAYRLKGDIDFDKARYAEAEKNYTKVLEYPQSKSIGYTQYRLGWTSYHLRKFPRALSWLEESLAWCDRWEKDATIQALEKEARRDLVSIYAETGDYRNAPVYFEKFLRGESKSWILDLARQLDKQGQYEKSAELYRYLIRKDPNSNDNLYFLTAILRGEGKLRNWKAALAAATEMTTIFGQTLQAAPKDSKPDEKTPIELVETDFREAVLAFHKEQAGAQTSALAPTLDELSQTYLRTFRHWPTSEPVYLREAQYLQRQHMYKEAVIYFREYVRRFAADAPIPNREEGMRGLVQSLEAASASPKQLKIGTLVPDADYRELFETSEEYQKQFPNAPAMRSIAYSGAYAAFVHGDLEKGLAACQKIFDFSPVDAQGKACFNNLRAAMYQQKNWRLTYEWATEIANRKFPGIDNYRNELITIRSESLLKWAEGEGNDNSAAKIYLSALDSRDLRPIWETALYDGFLRAHKGQDDVTALKAAARLEAEYPKSRFLVPVSFTRAQIYQDGGDYANAYPQLVYYLRKETKPESQEILAQTTLNAGVLASSLNKNEEASFWLAAYDKLPSATLSGKSLAVTLRNRMSGANRGLASISESRWDGLLTSKERFERAPIPTQGDLQSRIKQSAGELEKIARSFLDLSAAQTYEGNESLCAMATLYSTFERSLRDLALSAGENSPQVLKLAVPMATKAKEFGNDCLKRAADVEHDGPFFRQVNGRWGWEWDPILSQRVAQLVRDLSPHYPMFDPVTVNRDEATLLSMHLQKVGSAESWYSLVRARCQKGPSPLCRLTLTDAATKFPTAGKLLNATAILYGKESPELPSSLYARAYDKGSVAALPNLAYYHLKEGRISPGIHALRRSYADEAFEYDQELKEIIKPWVDR